MKNKIYFTLKQGNYEKIKNLAAESYVTESRFGPKLNELVARTYLLDFKNDPIEGETVRCSAMIQSGLDQKIDRIAEIHSISKNQVINQIIENA